jgi:hypothetical protein
MTNLPLRACTPTYTHADEVDFFVGSSPTQEIYLAIYHLEIYADLWQLHRQFIIWQFMRISGTYTGNLSSGSLC